MIDEERRARNRESTQRYRARYPERVKASRLRGKELHPGRANEASRKYRSKYPDRIRSRHLEERFGITPVEYICLLTAQEGHCAICERTSNNNGKASLSIDHDHITGKIRGLLCWQHNSLLGHIKDDPEQLRRLIKYLGRPPIDVIQLMGERLPSPGRNGQRRPREVCLGGRNESIKRYRQRNSALVKEWGLLHKYGITQACYDNILASQDGHCAICDRTTSEDGKPLSVDHNHRTGEIRGLLCWRHNLVLGYADDNIDQLEKLIKYLTDQH